MSFGAFSGSAGWGASVLSGIFCTPPVSSVLGPVELDPAGDSGACQPRKGGGENFPVLPW